LARDSTNAKIAEPMRPIRMNPPTVASVHSPNCLLVRPMSRNEIAIVKMTPPRMSKFRLAFFVLTTGSSRLMTKSAAMPIGMLT
jgi:hypothetical protein